MFLQSLLSAGHGDARTGLPLGELAVGAWWADHLRRCPRQAEGPCTVCSQALGPAGVLGWVYPMGFSDFPPSSAFRLCQNRAVV